MKKLIYSFITFLISVGIFIYYFYNYTIKIKNLYILIGGVVFLALSLIIFVIMIYDKKTKKIKLLENRLEVWNNISYHVSQAGDEAFNQLPIGILVYDDLYEIKWANKNIKSIFQSRLVDSSLGEISSEMIMNIKNKEEKFIIKHDNRFFEVVSNLENRILYFFDQTSRVSLQNKYNNRICAIGVIMIDNLEESLKRYDVLEKSNIRGQILGEITDYATKFGVYLQNSSTDRMIMILDRESLNKMIHDKFDILNEIRQISTNNHLKTSVSIGIACYDVEHDELGSLAQSAVELAEKRGGDQVVVNIQNEKIQYFGGKTNALEKNSLVHARLQTNAIKEAIESSGNVFVMCHNSADSDAFASMLAISKLCDASNKDCNIIFDIEKCDSTVRKLYQLLQNEEPEILDKFIKGNEVDFKSNSLLIVVDTQSPQIAMYPELIKEAKKLIVIDHHRRGEITFENPNISYVEPYASSTIELISEMFMFYGGEIEISPLIATIMLTGIVVDTNNFVYRTGARTFESASILKDFDADMVKVKMILRESIDIEKEIANAVLNADVILDNFAIVKITDENIINERTMLAKISDKLLEMDKVQAGFTIGYVNYNGQVGISARSYDSVNVQIIMEELGGGGHLNGAACQLKDTTVEKAYEQLLEILKREYENIGDENMKVILLTDVKGRGQKNQIIDVANGYANYLFTNKLAVIANEENIENLKKMEEQEKQDAINYKKLMEKLKSEIQEKSINIYIKLGADGKPFGHITTKQICEEFELQTGIKLDKRKVELPSEINSVGIYTAYVNLHKDVVANIAINVLEK